MSIKVFGFLESNSDLHLTKIIDMSFLVVEYATKNKIGIKLGGNVTDWYLKRFENQMKKQPFKITDDPLDVNAESLFNGYGITVHVNETRVDSGESLFVRMSRVQSFFKELLEIKEVEQIVLDINNDGDECETVMVHVNDFSNKIVALYEQEKNWTPSVRIMII